MLNRITIKKKIIKQIFSVLVILIAMVQISLFISHFVNFSGKKNNIENQLEENFGGKASIKGKVSFSLFPIPKFVISHLRLYDLHSGLFDVDVRAPEVSFAVSPFSLIFGNIDVSDIEVEKAKFDFKIKNSQTANKKSISKSFDHITIKESDLIISNERYKLFKEFNNFNGQIDNIGSGEKVDFQINADFESSLNDYEVKGKLSQESPDSIASIFEILSLPKNHKGYDQINANFTIESKYTPSNHDIAAKVQIKGNDVQHFIFNHIYRSKALFPDKSMGKFVTSFDVKFSNRIFELANLDFNSDEFTGSFKFKYDLAGEGEADLKIHSLSIDDLMTDEAKNLINYEIGLLGQDDQLVFSLPEDTKITFKVLANELYLKQNKISDLDAKFIFSGGEKTKFLANFIQADENNILAQGEILFEEDQVIFNGDIESQGKNFGALLKQSKLALNFVRDDVLKDYNFTSKFRLSSAIFNFTDIRAKIDDFNLKGDLSYNDSEDAESDSKISLYFDSINFDKYHVYDISKKPRHFLDLFYSYIANKDHNKSLFQRFIWLRNVNSKISFDIHADRFVMGGLQNNNMLISGLIRHRLFMINQFSIYDEDDKFNAAFTVDLGDNTEFNFSLLGEKINLDNYLYHEKIASNSWERDLLRLPKLSNLTFNSGVLLNKVKYKDLLINNLDIETDYRKGTLYFENFTGKLFDKGEFKIDGYYIISGLPTLNLAFQLANLEVDKFFKFMFGLDSFQTKASLSGNLTSFGQSASVFAKQLDMNLKIATSDIIINQLAIPKIIHYIANLTKIEFFDREFNFAEELKNGAVRYDPINLDFKMRKGKAVLNNLQLENKGMTASIIAKLDVTTKQLVLRAVHAFRAYYLSGKEVKNAEIRVDYGLDGSIFNLSSYIKANQLENLIKDLRIAYKPLIERRKQYFEFLEAEEKRRIEEQQQKIDSLEKEDLEGQQF